VLLQNSSCPHAVINAPVDSNSVSLARVLSDGSFPHVLTGSASTLDGFGTCSMFIRITACLLADPLSGLLHQGLRTFHYFHARLGCYRLERKLPGGFNALPLEFCAFSTAHQNGLLDILWPRVGLFNQAQSGDPRAGHRFDMQFEWTEG
jgi:hypothetical protein